MSKMPTHIERICSKLYNKEEAALILAIIVLYIVFFFLTPGFRTLSNIFVLLRQMAVTTVLAYGYFWTLMSGESDISFPGI